MSIRRQCYEWRNVTGSPTIPFILNQYPVTALNRFYTHALPQGKAVSIFNGSIGNNLDIPAELKAYQYVVIDSIGVWPPSLHAQIVVNTTKYFQDPDNVPSRQGGIGGYIVPYPNGQSEFSAPASMFSQAILNYDYTEGLIPAVIVRPGDSWDIQVTNQTASSSAYSNSDVDSLVNKCFVKYLLIDGADSIVAKRLIDAGWPLTVENLWQYKQDLLRTHLYAGLAPLPETVEKARRKV